MKKFFFLFIFMFLLSSCTKPSDDLKDVVWRIQYLPEAPSLRGLSAVSDREAWVSGSNGFCSLTRDGGTTWTRLMIPGSDSLDFRDVQAFAGGIAFLLSAGPGAQSVLFKTEDFGKNWKQVWRNPYPDGFCSGMAFWDEHRGMVFSDPVDGRFRVFLTRDGGQTWKEGDPQNMPPALKGEYAFAASGTCIFVWPPEKAAFVTGGQIARCFFSTNGGRTWQAVNLPIVHHSPSAGAFSIFVLPSGSGIVTGGDYRFPARMEGTFAFTEDGGKSWQTEKDQKLPYQSCAIALTIRGKRSWLSVGPEGTFLFSQKDRKWRKIADEGFHVVTMAPGGRRLWAAGAGGKVGTFLVPN